MQTLATPIPPIASPAQFGRTTGRKTIRLASRDLLLPSRPRNGGRSSMVELQFVVLAVAGSSPVDHPISPPSVSVDRPILKSRNNPELPGITLNAGLLLGFIQSKSGSLSRQDGRSFPHRVDRRLLRNFPIAEFACPKWVTPFFRVTDTQGPKN